MRRAGGSTMGAAALVAMAVVVSACSNGGGAATNAPATAAPTTAAAGVTLAMKQDATLGAFVTGKDGLSLYIFTNDSAGTSTCTDTCAGTWPPLTVASAADVTAGSGVTGAIATISRADGTLQVTLGGAPLYYYSGDTAAGQTMGQGLFNKWYVASPTGTAVKGAAAVTSAPAATAAPVGTTAPGDSKCSGPTCY
ncbi:MAG: COG4315 family predicted lipoprotein [bacterium]